MATNEYYEPTTEEFKAEVRAQFAALETRLQEAEAERNRLATALTEALDLLEQIPSGIDKEADPEDLSPDDATAHVAGLIWQRLSKEVEHG